MCLYFLSQFGSGHSIVGGELGVVPGGASRFVGVVVDVVVAVDDDVIDDRLEGAADDDNDDEVVESLLPWPLEVDKDDVVDVIVVVVEDAGVDPVDVDEAEDDAETMASFRPTPMAEMLAALEMEDAVVVAPRPRLLPVLLLVLLWLLLLPLALFPMLMLLLLLLPLMAFLTGEAARLWEPKSLTASLSLSIL